MIPTLRITDEQELQAEAVVIGSGAGGATTALMLAEAGVDVLIVEEGGYNSTEQFDRPIAESMAALYRDGGLTPILGKPTIAFAEGRCLGGSTVINGALFWRAPEDLLSRWEHDLHLPDLGSGCLARHYATIETDLFVAPQPARDSNRASWKLATACDTLGWRWELAPRAQNSCRNSNRCPTGCPNGAKQSMLVSYLPRAVAAGARIVCNARVGKILFEGSRAIGVEVAIDQPDAGERRIEIRAERIFVCGGPMQTPYLLRRSGIRAAGKSLGLHLNLKVAAVFPDDLDPGNGTIMAAQSKEFADRDIYFGTSTFDPVYLAMTMATHGQQVVQEAMAAWRRTSIFVGQIKAAGSGRVNVYPFLKHPVPTYRLCRADMANIRFALDRLAELLFAAGAERIYLPICGTGAVPDMDSARRLTQGPIEPRALDLLSVHAMGSCPLGGTLDAWGRVRGTENLFVNDASMLPEATGVSPQMTIMAVTRRNIEKMLSEESARR